TRDRLTAPPGFEVRSPHRERDSSIDLLRGHGREELDTGRVDAPHVLATNRKSVPIEKLEDLNGDLTTVVQAVAELSRGKPAFGRGPGHVDGDLRHALHHRPQEEVIVGDLFHVSPPRRHTHESAHEILIDRHRGSDVAYARWPERLSGKMRPDQRPQ